MYKILIVEDDLPMAQAIQKEMKMWGNEAEYVRDFQNVLTTFTEYDPHLVLMDITLPFYNGYHWCSEIRRISNVPVIFISSASDNMNIIMAVNMGGDDFIPKPFDLSVLTAKVQAVLRRTYDLAGKIPVLEQLQSSNQHWRVASFQPREQIKRRILPAEPVNDHHIIKNGPLCRKSEIRAIIPAQTLLRSDTTHQNSKRNPLEMSIHHVVLGFL